MSDFPSTVKTYSFDDKPKKEKKIIPNKEENNIFQILSNNGEVLTTGYSTYATTRLYGYRVIKQGANTYPSVRTVTKSNLIEDYWRDRGYSRFQGTKISFYELHAYVNSSTCKGCSLWPKDPITEKTEYFKLPVYIPLLGFTDLDVRVSNVAFTGKGTNSFKYSSTWGKGVSWHVARDPDDVTITEKSDNAIGGVFEFKTEYLTPKQYHRLDGTTKVEYWTRYINMSGGFHYLSKTESTTFMFNFDVQ